MKQTKYITSGGLAFSEDQDMEKLRRFSLKGWHVSGFTFLGYTLEKGESSDYIYSVDYRSLRENEEDEYFDFFSSSGWSHIASEANIHLFRAQPGTKPIYTDRDTTIEKYNDSSDSIKKLAIPFILLSALVWVCAMISSGTLQSIFLGVSVISSVIAIPTAWTLITTYRNKWKIEERKGLVNLVKTIPFLLLLIAVLLLLFGGDTNTDSAINLLTYMIAGAIALPSVIWVIMSLDQQMRRKRA
ncbi:hypothetical protein A374_03964 [Fictibacillus macauensis ZFHKF-1]|uniref:DUF2812 domain-containing protein n=1 Tax=Fictibacillus macauensis ZFHKF-1 TaxID=1196324 RepID=I8ALC8_9BACL|nr:DUF2812 domain-containing protein [Fictibacillus macauensis]EIT86697.1 hypothetical protein A374_03964 [Fictibacillus macauensis ZFHKF-1]